MRGRWWFDPARRWRGGKRELVWRGSHSPENGDYCIAEVPEYGPALLVEVLGADERPQWDDLSVISQFRLRVPFPARAQAEARAHGEPGTRERRGRLDLRERLVFTIDPEDARDHDDALSVERLTTQRYEVGIHIADVSYYVTPDSALDLEARERGTSTYLPGAVVPMLPESLSADLCSLRPDRDRLAISVMVELDASGRVHGFRFAETVIRSRHSLNYTEVQDALDGRRKLANDVQAALETVRDLARGLRRKRRAAGALELEVPEVKAWVDAHGDVIRIERRPHLESHELIEEFMLLANRCVGSEGARRRAGVLFRVHDPPLAAKLATLDKQLKTLGLPRPGDLSDPARALQQLLSVPLDAPRRRLLHRMVLRSLSRARYDASDSGHFGLACREYSHFTSPIRRYPDLHNHARVREWIRGVPDGGWDPLAIEELAASVTASEQIATDAEREAVRVKGLRHLEGRLGDHASGMITGLVPRGLFVELDDVPVEGFVRVSDLDDQFVLDPTGVRMVGRRSRKRFALGDPIDVVIARIDVPARECDFAVEAPRRPRHRRHGRK